MKRGVVILAVVGILALIVLLPSFQFRITSGYGGMSSSIYSIESPIYDQLDETERTIEDTTASIYPPTRILPLGLVVGCTGLRAELGQPQYRDDRLDFSESVSEIQEDKNVTKIWKVKIVHFDMSLTIRTDGIGPDPIVDVSFWIEVSENHYSVFEKSTDVRAYILEVKTKDMTEMSDPNLVDVEPLASGYNFPLETVSKDKIPQWILDANYTGVLSGLSDVRFRVKVKNMAPFLFGLIRYEQHATFKLEMDVLVFGFWKIVSDYDEWEYPEVPKLPDLFGWIAELLFALGLGLWLLFGGIISILSLWKGGKYGPVFFVVIWAIFLGAAVLVGLITLV